MADPTAVPPQPSPSPLWRAAAALAAILWGASLFAPAVGVHMADGRQVTHTGAVLLMLGWMGVFGLQIAWVANPLLALVTILAALGRRPPWWLAFGALAVGLTSLIPFDFVGANEGETGRTSPALGQLLWLLSLAVFPALHLLRAAHPLGRPRA